MKNKRFLMRKLNTINPGQILKLIKLNKPAKITMMTTGNLKNKKK